MDHFSDASRLRFPRAAVIGLVLCIGATSGAMASSFTFAETVLPVGENGGGAVVAILRDQPGTVEKIGLRSESISGELLPPGALPATGGLDYAVTSREIEFGVSDSVAIAVVPINNDDEPEGAEAFLLRLQGEGQTTGGPLVVVINDDELEELPDVGLAIAGPDFWGENQPCIEYELLAANRTANSFDGLVLEWKPDPATRPHPPFHCGIMTNRFRQPASRPGWLQEVVGLPPNGTVSIRVPAGLSPRIYGANLITHLEARFGSSEFPRASHLSQFGVPCPEEGLGSLFCCLFEALRRLDLSFRQDSGQSLAGVGNLQVPALPGAFRRASGALKRFFDTGADLFLLYDVRNRLQETPGGRRLVALYREHQQAVKEAVLADLTLADDTIDLLDRWRPLLAAFTAYREDQETVTASQVIELAAYRERLRQSLDPELMAAIDREWAAIDLDSAAGRTAGELVERLGRLGCGGGQDDTLCLQDGRFEVAVEWTDFEGSFGGATSVPFGSVDSGLLWYFDSENWEMLVKVLDGCGVNGRFWVFAAATTNVAYTLTVRDTATGELRTYDNPLGQASPALTDTRAFATCEAAAPAAGPRVLQRPFAVPAAPPPAIGGGGCVAGDEALCLAGERFRVEVQWRDFAGVTGSARAVPFGSADSGLLWFFEADNWEMLVKVLDGCGVNGHFWVFAAATTNVAYTLEVTDTETGQSQTYDNPLGQASPAITDTGAFAVCP